jgi:hypothetical protein
MTHSQSTYRAIFTAFPFVCVQAALGNGFRRDAERLAARVNAAVPLFTNLVGVVLLPHANEQLLTVPPPTTVRSAPFLASLQDSSCEKPNLSLSPVLGVQIPILAENSIFTQLLNSFLHFGARGDLDGNHAGKDLGHVTKDFGEIPNGRVKFRVSDDERAHSAARGSSEQDRTYSSRSPKTQMEILTRILGLVR